VIQNRANLDDTLNHLLDLLCDKEAGLVDLRDVLNTALNRHAALLAGEVESQVIPPEVMALGNVAAEVWRSAVNSSAALIRPEGSEALSEVDWKERHAQITHDLGGGPLAARAATVLVRSGYKSMQEVRQGYNVVGEARFRNRFGSERNLGPKSMELLISHLKEGK
jgi:hypothetical protein